MSWSDVIQAGLLALFTWYVRSGQKKETTTVIRSTAAQSTSNEILAEVEALRRDVELLKSRALVDNRPDDRGPRPPK